MSIKLILCGVCTPSQPDVYQLVEVLRQELAGEVVIEELECMAACDESPAVMIGHEYHPQVTAASLQQLVETQVLRLRQNG